MPHANLGFETADGGNAGLAASWTFAAAFGAEAHAGIAGADGIERAWESFEVDWDVAGYLLDLGPSAEATYSASFFEFPPSHETFEVGWAADQALRTEVAPSAAADYATGGGPLVPYEAFEAGWGVTFADELGSVVALPPESFASGWGNDAFSLTLGASSSALLYEGSETVESFEDYYAPRVFTAVPATDTLHTTVYSHGLSDGDIVELYSTGRLPAGLNPGARYWVDATGTHTLKLDALAPGDGPAIVDITDAGVGTHSFVRTRTLFWTIFMDEV